MIRQSKRALLKELSLKIRRILSIRRVALVLGILLVAVAAYGFAATNTVPPTGAGDGVGTISGYTVSAVTYDVDGDSDPSTLENVLFTLAADGASDVLPTTVEIQLIATAGLWYSCTTTDLDLAAPADYTCAISPSLDVDLLDQLRVVAAE